METIVRFLIGLYYMLWNVQYLPPKQKDPVSWAFTAIRIQPGIYQVHMQAQIDNGWHIYAQHQPKDAICYPTTFKFEKNTMVKRLKIEEYGHIIHKKDTIVGFQSDEFQNYVDFSMKVIVANREDALLKGSVTYQACTEEVCLPQKEIRFQISLR